MAYENNHYIPQFVLRNFGNKINRYNLKTNSIIYKGSVKNAFNEKNIYPEWLELMLRDLESRIANFLNLKILVSCSNVTLTRSDLWLIKKFFCIEMFRVPGSLSNKKNIDEITQMKSMGFVEFEIDGESDQDYAFRTMKVVLESNSLEEVYKHQFVTYEACKWMTLYNNCYLNIWDSTECKEDFIITDNGMNCEHDKSRFVPFYNLCNSKNWYTNEKDEMIKRGYLLEMMEKSNIVDRYAYSAIWMRSIFVHANCYFFAVSNTRTISLVDPFYRLYYDNNFKKPDVWPSNFSEYAFKANDTQYSEIGKYNTKDLYFYEVKQIELMDVVNMNCLMLDRVYETIGFDDSSKISRSLNVYSLTTKKYQRNDYDGLINILKENGIEFPKRRKYEEMNNKLTRYPFSEAEHRCIEKFYSLILKQKSDIK